MFKNILTFFAFAFFLNFSYCQVHNSVSLGPELGVGLNFGRSPIGVGGSLEYLAKITPQGGIRLFTGYHYFHNPKVSNDDVAFWPIRAGYQQFIYKDVFFLYAEVGIANFLGGSGGGDKTDFSFGSGAGLRLNMNDHGGFMQLSGNINYMKYTPGRNYSWITFRAAYGLSWGKGNRKKED